MALTYTERASDSPFVQRVWTSTNSAPTTFTSVAEVYTELVAWRIGGDTGVLLRGPESRAQVLDVPADAEWFGVTLRLATHLAAARPAAMLDLADVELPADRHGFWLAGRRWPLPTEGNAEDLVCSLGAAGAVTTDPLVVDLLAGDPARQVPARTKQHRFRHAIGLSQQTLVQIRRARAAGALVHRGATAAEAVHALGFYDQAHLTRAVRRYLGSSPGRLLDAPPVLGLG